MAAAVDCFSGMINCWMSRLVAAKEASLAVIPPASALAQFITHHVRCHFTLSDTVSKEDLIIPPIGTEALVLYTHSPEGKLLIEDQGNVGLNSCSHADQNRLVISH